MRFLPRLIVLAALAGALGFLSLAMHFETTRAADGDDPGPPKSLSIKTGRTTDGGFTLAGRDSGQQIVVDGQFDGGALRDLTRKVTYTIAPEGIADVSPTGWVSSIKEGQATIHARGPGDMDATIRVTVTDIVRDVPVSFPNEVVPIFTKFGCNSGGCHGKSGGQNGFALSLLGFEPTEDFEYLVKEARGRRISPAAPDASLLLRKAAGVSPHGGGTRIAVDSPSYRIIRRWVEQGVPYGQPDDPVVDRIEVFPKERLLTSGGEQQLIVVAHYSDGSTRDVTRLTQFESNATDIAEVDERGLVTVKDMAGSAAIMTRYQATVDVFRATIPLGVEVKDLPPAKGFIDELVYKRWQQLGLPPSDLCDDGTFLRRATIDIAGRLPTLEETKAFLADKAKDKRERLVDRLLESKDYADYFANKWSAVLRNRRADANADPKPTFAFHAWIHDSLAENKPYDELVRGVLTATGEETKDPPTIWYREVKDPTAQLEDVAQLFLGQRLQCARCHHHPYEKWSQQDYYGMVAFFSRLEVKDPPRPRKKKGMKKPPPKPPLTVKHKPGKAQAVNIKTGQPVKPTGLGDEPMEIGDDVDPRTRLVDWMVAKDNPYFAKTLVNRYWKHFFSRGLVDPEDDMRVTNPSTNPELLDALAQQFTQNKYDLKKLVRTICMSRIYQLSAESNGHNSGDKQNYSRFFPKRLNAEVLLDAIDQLTLTQTRFKGMPAGTRAVQLPDNAFDSYFLTVFGRPNSSSACECERSSDASLAQLLHLLNSKEILDKAGGRRATDLAKDQRPHADRIRELYLVALSREPSPKELSILTAHVEKRGKDVAGAYEDIVWSLINAEEFLFNH